MSTPVSQGSTINAVSHPLIDTDGLNTQPLRNAPANFVIRFVLGLRRLLLRLADWVVPADAALFERCIGVGHTHMLGFIARQRIADLLLPGPLTAEEIAQRCACHPDAVHRLMRAAVTSGIFRLDKFKRFTHNRLSRALCRGELSRVADFAQYFSSKSNCDAYAEIDYILTSGNDGFERAHHCDLWQWLSNHQTEHRAFTQMMMGVTISEAPMIAKLYPFKNVRRLCDVGGGSGVLLAELLLRNPKLQGVLFDISSIIQTAPALFKARGVENRVSYVAGDFYQTIVSGCDAYLLKNILHDWDDHRCLEILSNCRHAMEKSAKILIVELILEKYDQHNFASYRDIHVMTVCRGGRERSRTEYQQLLQQSGFTLNAIYSSSIISVIEGVAV